MSLHNRVSRLESQNSFIIRLVLCIVPASCLLIYLFSTEWPKAQANAPAPDATARVYKSYGPNPVRDILVTKSTVDIPVPDMVIPVELVEDTTVLIYFDPGPMDNRHSETIWLSLGYDDVVVHSKPIDSRYAPFGISALWIGDIPAGQREIKAWWRTQGGTEVRMGDKGGAPRRLVVVEFP